MRDPSTCSRRRKTAFALLVGILLAGLLIARGGQIYRAVFYHSLVQRSLLPPLQTVCSGIETLLSGGGDPWSQVEKRYRDLPIPKALQSPAGIASGTAANRVFLLCLDGASWREIEELGPLENFERLRREGIWTTHLSTILPISSCAWNAIDTGYLPGQTGVLSFFRPGDDWPPRWTPLSAGCFPTTTLAQRVARQGEGVFTIHLMNSVPEQIPSGGAVVGGLWSAKHSFATPGELLEALIERGYAPRLEKKPRLRLLGLLAVLWLVGAAGVFVRLRKRHSGSERFVLPGFTVITIVIVLFAIVYWKRNHDFRTPEYRVRVHLEDELYPRAQIALRLFEQPGWRFGALMLKGIDALSHSYYQIEETRRARYRETDRVLGLVMDRADERTLLVVVSDHGMRSYTKAFDLPAWLYKEGYLTDDAATTRATAVHEFAGNVGCIRLRNPGPGTEIQQRLMALRDPLTGEKLVERVYSLEEAFQGSETAEMPQWVVETNPKYQVLAYERRFWRKEHGRFQSPPSNDPLYSTKTPFGPPIKVYQEWFRGGNHERRGMVGLWGPAVKRMGRVEDIAIEDIAPMLMAALDVPLPEDLPGKAHPEYFTEAFAQAHPLRRVLDPVQPAPSMLTSEIDPETLKTLEALDYLK